MRIPLLTALVVVTLGGAGGSSRAAPAAGASAQAARAPAPAAGASAHGADNEARRSKVAVTVGSRTVTVGELEDRLAEIPSFQIATFGASPDEIVETFVEQNVVRELLLGSGAEARKLETKSPTKEQLQRARGTATLRALRSRTSLKSPAAIPAEDIAKFYEDNRDRFDAPERVNLWRILCKTSDEAASVLGEAKRDPTIPKFNDLARDHSTDKATQFRGGNLGFLSADGASNEAGLKVDPNLVKAASSVKDGDFVPAPVPEAGGYAVIWRRATVPATRRSLEEATAQIRTSLYRERVEAEEKKLAADLRAKNVHDVDAEPLKIVVLPAFDAGLNLPRSIPRPTEAPREKAR